MTANHCAKFTSQNVKWGKRGHSWFWAGVPAILGVMAGRTVTSIMLTPSPAKSLSSMLVPRRPAMNTLKSSSSSIEARMSLNCDDISRMLPERATRCTAPRVSHSVSGGSCERAPRPWVKMDDRGEGGLIGRRHTHHCHAARRAPRLWKPCVRAPASGCRPQARLGSHRHEGRRHAVQLGQQRSGRQGVGEEEGQ